MSTPIDASTGDAAPDTDPPVTRRRRRRLPFWAEIPLLLVLAAVIAVAVQGFLVRVFVIPSGSMETTLIGCPGCTDDRVAVDRMTYRFRSPAPGDVVVFRAPPSWASNGEVADPHPPATFGQTLLNLSAYASLSSPDEKDFVKRVVAVGGQTVACCTDNHVTVDGRPLTEPYVHYQPGTPPQQKPFAPVRLAPGQLWVMGDNRNNSADSRDHGPIGTDDLVGQVRAVVLPVARWRTVPSIAGH